jgi:hypothetical protein
MSGGYVRTSNPPEGDDQIGRPGWRWDHVINVLIGIASAFLAAGLLALTGAAQDARRAAAAAEWPAVPGIITVSEPDLARRPGLSTAWVPSARLAYAYEVGGRPYSGDQVTLRPPVPDAAGRTAQRLLAAYPAGSPVTVYYDPADPADAVLVRANPSDSLRPALVLLGTAAVLLLVAWVMRRVGPPGVAR